MSIKFDRLTPTGLIRIVAEAVLLFLIAWAPWPFASAEYAYEAILIGGTSFLVLLWLVYGLFSGQLRIRPDAISGCLLGFVLLTAVQLIPLPESIVGVISPTRLQLHKQMIPATLELLPGETAAEPRPTAIPLTFDPFLTRVFLSQMIAILLLYLVVRSWLASREALRRVAWVCAANGIALALIGLTQFFSSEPGVVFWSVKTDGAVFGPFVCKNHYPDFVLFCLGLGFGLLASKQPAKSVKVRGVEYRRSTITLLGDSPDLFVMGIGLILVILSIPFTLSRGGLIGTVIAGAAIFAIVYKTRGGLTKGVALGGLLVALALLLGAWFGWGLVSERLDTLWSGKARNERATLWTDVSTLVPDFLAAGGGDGAFSRFESITRTGVTRELMVMENAHNEYLEAILEGGLLRLALTLALCVLVIRASLQAYARLATRSSGPLILGVLFGLIGLIVHSFVDFGIHIPAVAFLATVLTAFVADAATDPTYVPYKKKTDAPPPPDPGRRTLTGVAMIAAVLVLAPISIGLTLECAKRGRAQELKVVARDAANAGGLDQHAVRLAALTAAVELTPSDGYAWMMLSQAHLHAALDERRLTAMALAGRPVIAALSDDAFIAGQGEQVRLGLQAAQRARSVSPLLPAPHLYMGRYAAGFSTGEPARTHFDRAIKADPSDPDAYIYRGVEAARRDPKAALEDWQRIVKLDPPRIPEVLDAARRFLSVSQILKQLLPDDPVVLWTAAAQLAPESRATLSADRRIMLEAIAALERSDWDGRGWEAIAKSNHELGRTDAAFDAWKKAVAKEPDSFAIRDGYSRWLEADERNELAEQQLIWLIGKHDHTRLKDRIDAIRHAMALKKKIESP